METTVKIMEDLRAYIKDNYITNPANVKEALAKVIAKLMDKGERNQLCQDRPLVILMIGINGGGKTTSIAKIGHKPVSYTHLDVYKRQDQEKVNT